MLYYFGYVTLWIFVATVLLSFYDICYNVNAIVMNKETTIVTRTFMVHGVLAIINGAKFIASWFGVYAFIFENKSIYLLPGLIVFPLGTVSVAIIEGLFVNSTMAVIKLVMYLLAVVPVWRYYKMSKKVEEDQQCIIVKV